LQPYPSSAGMQQLASQIDWDESELLKTAELLEFKIYKLKRDAKALI